AFRRGCRPLSARTISGRTPRLRDVSSGSDRRRWWSAPRSARFSLLLLAAHPRSECGWLFDDLIRPQQQRRWDREAKGLGGLEVDDQFELRRLLDGEVGRLGALEDLVHEICRSAVKLRQIRPV